MRVTKYGEYPDSIAFMVYSEDDRLLGWVHYIKSEDGLRYAVSGPVGTHARVQQLVLDYFAEKELLE